MTSTDERVLSCDELHAGMPIEARSQAEMPFQGRVGAIMPEMRLFWAVSPTGLRRIFELDEYEVYRL